MFPSTSFSELFLLCTNLVEIMKACMMLLFDEDKIICVRITAIYNENVHVIF